MTLEEQEGALSVLTILDLSEGVAGPYAAQLFAHCGARVIKVERPGTGDVSRSWGTFDRLNSGKLGLSLDYETEDGAAVLRRLAEDADGIIEDQPTRRRADLGLGDDDLLGRIPRLVITQVSAFGGSGPYSGRPLTGLTLAAASGLLALDGAGEVDASGVEKAVALHVFVATLAGLWRAAQTEHGQVIEIAGIEALASTLGAPLARELAGVSSGRESHEPAAPGMLSAPRAGAPVAHAAAGTLPFILSSTPASSAQHAPALGAHTDYVLHDLIGFDAAEIEVLRGKGLDMTLPLPLGLSRVLDLTTSAAGAYATMLLGDFGAEVILVESDGVSCFRARNPLLAPRLLRNKFACALDIRKQEGKDACLRLSAASDFVFVDAGQDATLSYNVVSAVRPDVIFVEVEASDSLEVGLAAAGAAFTALFHHRKSGDGQQVRVTADGVAASLQAALLTPDRPPSGCYRCIDGAVAVALRSAEDETALRRIVGAGSDLPEEKLRDHLERWAADQKVEAAGAALRDAGLAAEPVRSPAQLVADPHLGSRGFFESVASPAGVRLMEGPAYRFGGTPAHTRVPAPGFGEHTDYVLREIAGLGEDEIARLRESGVVAAAPIEAQ